MTDPDTTDVTGWFEPLYAASGGDVDRIPWAQGGAHPGIELWRAHDREGLLDDGVGRTAIVVGCGLGDDAVDLAAAGWTVTAFDVAPSAIAQARARHPDAAVDWHVADLFAPPPTWVDRFDLVVEVFTVQALPPHVRVETMAAIVRLARPGGDLLAVWAPEHDAARRSDGPPWRFDTGDERRWETAAGLTLVRRVDRPLSEGQPLVAAHYRRPHESGNAGNASEPDRSASGASPGDAGG